MTYNKFEPSCIPKTMIERCYDYKTKENCINDVNKLGCEWISSLNYTPVSIFTFENGICIANTSIAKHKYFNKREYSFRGNYVNNPSFESPIGKNWKVTGNTSSILRVGNTFDGKKYIELENGVVIKQKLVGFNPNIVYLPFLFLRGTDFNNNSKIFFTIKFKYENGTEKTVVDSKKLSDIYGADTLGGYFKLVKFPLFQPKANLSYINISINSEGVGNFSVDAISLAPSKRNGVTISDLIFEPVDIIPPSASNCNLCFDKDNLNFCTRKKSNFLGDCSYMVENSSSSYTSKVSNYLGNSTNPYMFNLKDKKLSHDSIWESQSLPNADLFCGLYLTKIQCLNPNNYVNSKFTKLNPFAGNTLCKWNSKYGCFKDSNNDNLSDTIGLIPLLSSRNAFTTFAGYIYNENDNKPSDFELGCDLLPPSSSIFFSGIDSSGKKVIVDSNESELIGNVAIHLYASDYKLPSCSVFNISSKIYVDFDVNGKKYYRYINSNQLKDSDFIKDYFKNETTSFIQNGQNNISIIVKDQSGNFGAEHNFSMNLDVSGPEINLTNKNLTKFDDEHYLINGTLTNTSILHFTFYDYSGNVTDCGYELTPEYDVDSSYYNSSGVFNVTRKDEKDFEKDFKLPIYNSTASGDSYTLTIFCSDEFGQKTTKNYFFDFDMNTNLVLVSPKNFRNVISNEGFFNSSFPINLISSDKGLKTCSAKFDSGESFNLKLIPNEDGFHYSDFDTLFYKNITGTLTFSTNGRKNGTVTCTDEHGNKATQKLDYFYDTTKPNMLNYSIINSSSSGIKNFVYVNGKYYTWEKNLPTLKVFIDATGSFLDSNSLNLSLQNGNVDNVGAIFSNFNITNTTTQPDSFEINHYSSFMNLGYYGDKIGNKGLYQLNFKLKFSDKAGNSNTGNINLFYDNSTPKFIFSGDIKNQRDGKIYTSSYNPEINVSFNTPSYRKFTCRIIANDGTYSFSKNYDTMVNSLSFNMSDIMSTSVVDLSKNKHLSLTLNCKDIYGKSISSKYRIVYDTTPPILNSINLVRGNEVYYINNENAIYDNYIDSLIFNFNDTNEDFYDCNYKFTSSSDYYICNSSQRNISFSGDSAMKEASGLNIIGERPQRPNSSIAICLRSPTLKNKQELTSKNNKSFVTNLNISASCKDAVGLSTKVRNLDMKIYYVAGGKLIDFKFNFKDKKAYPIVRSMIAFPKILISYDSNGLNPLLELNSPKRENGIYIYTSNTGIDLRELKGDHNILWAVAEDSGNNTIDAISSVLDRDITPPSVSINIPDKDENNYVYSNTFEIDTSAVDSQSQLSKVELIYNGTTIFSYSPSSSNMTVNRTFLLNANPSMNLFGLDKKSFTGKLFFKGAEVGKNYSFEFRAYDSNNNVNTSFIEVEDKPGIGIRLLDTSGNSYVDSSSMFWISNKKNPIISFETSKSVNYCAIYPFIDKNWGIILNDKTINSKYLQKTNDGTNKFSFDLSSLNGFDMSKFPSIFNPIKIICSYNNTLYNYTRDLMFIDFLPDYTLTSSEGFAFTESPYQTTINVKSVGPYKSISCQYSIDSGNYQDLMPKVSTSFVKVLSFSDLSSGRHTLNLKCNDIAGDIGPIKHYSFLVDKSGIIRMSNFSLYSSNGFKYGKDSSDSYYISENGVNLKFYLNMKSSVSCNYMINPSGNAVSNIISFFKNLFKIGEKEIPTGVNPYEFKVGGLNFKDGTNDLKIDCSNGADTLTKDFNVIKSSNTQLGLNVSIE